MPYCFPISIQSVAWYWGAVGETTRPRQRHNRLLLAEPPCLGVDERLQEPPFLPKSGQFLGDPVAPVRGGFGSEPLLRRPGHRQFVRVDSGRRSRRSEGSFRRRRSRRSPTTRPTNEARRRDAPASRPRRQRRRVQGWTVLANDPRPPGASSALHDQDNCRRDIGTVTGTSGQYLSGALRL